MKERFFRAMDGLHQACMVVAGASLVVITIIIPYGVFTRYVLNSAASWPEPLAVLLMIVLSFLSAVVCYREYRHIGIVIVPNLLGAAGKRVLGWLVELAMLGTNLFMLWYGSKLVMVTWFQSIAEVPALSVGVTYLPIPIGGAITALLVIERLMSGRFFEDPAGDGGVTATVSTE